MKNLRYGLVFCLILLILVILPLKSWAIELLNLETSLIESTENEEFLEIDPFQEDLSGSFTQAKRSVDQQIIVLYKEGSEKAKTSEIEMDYQIKSLSDHLDLIELRDVAGIDQAIAELSKDSNVLAVERNGILKASILPDDPYIKDGSAWYFQKMGGLETWDKAKESEQIVVAVIDTGLNINHPDLENRYLEGYDFVEGSNVMKDLSGHGTMVSGCVAAVANNGMGISGITGLANIKIRPYRTGGVKPGDRNLYISHIAAAIMEASDQEDVRVINMSFGTYNQYDSIRKSIEYASSKGKILVSSAGNEGGTSRGGQYGYPASYEQVISVAATDKNDNRPNYSQYNDQVNLTAPGDSIISTNRLGGYGPGSGTSFSAPLVSGSCAFLLALKNDLSPNEVQKILEKTALDLGSPGKDPYFGCGRIQLDKAYNYIEGTRPLTGISFESSQISLLKGHDIVLKVNYIPEDTTDERSVIWTSSDENIAKIDKNGEISAINLGMTIISAKVGDFEATCKVIVKENPKIISPEYQTHIQNYAWQEWKRDGEISGTTGESLRLEGIRIEIEDIDLGVRYLTHIQDKGWESNWFYDGALSGSVGQSKRLEAIQIELTGLNRELYDIYYQVHAENLGWLDWAKNGQAAGTEGLSLRLEAIIIKVLPKGAEAPGSVKEPFIKTPDNFY